MSAAMSNTQIRISKVEEAECPEDGGRWAIHCEHLVDGEWLSFAVLQDTNKRRLSEWRSSKFSDGLTTWCDECQQMTSEPKRAAERLRDETIAAKMIAMGW
jgi:hypothetical protein